MASTVALADYLFRRLCQLGVGSVHGVPGDTNLPLLDHVEPSGLRWIGSANELNAAYAADGYARIKGLGVLVTTFGVGELSALNGVAGAYAERAAVVHIVGTPTRAQQDARHFVHHSIKHGDFHTFAQMYSHITIAQARLWDPQTGPKQIDEVLSQCLRHSRPVYIEFPMDLVSALVPDAGLDCAIKLAGAEPTVPRDDALERILRRIYNATQPVILVDGESRAMGILDNVQRLIELTKWPTWTTPFGKGLLNETLSNIHGIYRGKHDDEAVRSFVAEADLILCFGPQFSSTNTYNFSSVPRADVTISFIDTAIQIGNETLRDIPAKYITSRLLQDLEPSKLKCYEPYPNLPRDSPLDFSEAPDDLPITHDRLWRLFASILRPGDIVLGDTGTSGHGVREMALPEHTRLFTHATWLCVGYALPAAQGAALAQQELITSSQYFGVTKPRTILFIGDGGFQMTVQELATIIRCDLDIVLVLINNGGYTTERCLHGRKQAYNDIAPLTYLQVPACFGARDDIYTASVRTWRELKEVLRNSQLNDGQGLRMVELQMGREDAPSGGLQSALRVQKDAEIVLPVNGVRK
jgi:pyruvate decarboxylase